MNLRDMQIIMIVVCLLALTALCASTYDKNTARIAALESRITELEQRNK